MAKKFNNGQTFGEIRQILNDNADEINSNTTLANNAKSAAEQMANGTTAGRVKGTASKIGIISNLLSAIGDVYFNDGVATTAIVTIPGAYTLPQYAVQAKNLNVATLFRINGEYVGGWKGAGSYAYNALAHMCNGYIIALDLESGLFWRFNDVEYVWKQIGISVATANTLGGIKIGAGLTTTADGTTRIADNVNLPGSNPTASSASIITSDSPDAQIVTLGALYSGIPLSLPTNNKPAGPLALISNIPKNPSIVLTQFLFPLTGHKMTVIVNSGEYSIIRFALVFGGANTEYFEVAIGNVTNFTDYMIELAIWKSSNDKIYIAKTIAECTVHSN